MIFTGTAVTQLWGDLFAMSLEPYNHSYNKKAVDRHYTQHHMTWGIRRQALCTNELF